MARVDHKIADDLSSYTPNVSNSPVRTSPSSLGGREVSVITKGQQSRIDTGKNGGRWVASGYILAAIAIVGIAASIGLGIHTHKLFLGLVPTVGSGLVGMAAYGAISHGKDKLNPQAERKGVPARGRGAPRGHHACVRQKKAHKTD